MKKLVQARMLSVRKGRYSSSPSPFRWLAFAVAVTNAKADMWNCRTGGDGGRITAGSKTVVLNRQ